MTQTDGMVANTALVRQVPDMNPNSWLLLCRTVRFGDTQRFFNGIFI